MDLFIINKYGSVISTMPDTCNEGTKLEMNTSIVGLVPADQYSPDMFYLMVSEGELLFVTSGQVYNGESAVYRVDTKNHFLEPVTSNCTQALFLGRNRCISIDCNEVPTIQVDSIYYANVSHIRSYDYEALSWEEEATHVDGYGVRSLWDNERPFALDQLLAEY
jgi:hypothetical protein